MRGALAHLGSALVGLLRTRLELAALEFGEARRNTAERFVLILIAAVCFAFALLAASALIVVLYWDTNRIAALGGIAIAYLLVGLGALWRFSIKKRASASPFAGTLAELERDRAWLAGELGDRK